MSTNLTGRRDPPPPGYASSLAGSMKRRSMDTATGQSARVLPEMIMRRSASPVTSVVVGVDNSAGSAAAVTWAAAEACRRQVVLRIVSAWDEPDDPGPPLAGDPARLAAGRVQKALTRVLGRPHFPRHIACATPRGRPGPVLLTEAGPAGLLVLGMTRIGGTPASGRVNWYCLRRGRCPLVFVPADRSAGRSNFLLEVAISRCGDALS